MWWHLTWKNIHVELKFFRLEFHHFIFLLLPCVSSFFFVHLAFFFVLRRYKSEDQIVQVPTQHSIIQSTRSAHPAFNHPINQIVSSFFLCSLELQIVPLQIYSSSVLLQIGLPLFFFKYVLLQVQKSSLRDSVLLFRTQVYKTRDLCGIIRPTHQVGIEFLTLKFQTKIESIKLEILVCKILLNAC